MGNIVVHPVVRALEEELQLALAEKAELDRKKAEIDLKVAGLARAVQDLRQVYGIPGSASDDLTQWTDMGFGITDQVRDALKKSPTWVSPTGVRSLIRNRKVVEAYANPMAVIHQVLRRLEEQHEIEVKELESGKKVYRWINRKK
jgi:hypothetical protein